MDPQTYMLIGVSVTLVLSLLAGAFGLGKLFQRVDTLQQRMDTLEPSINTLAGEVSQLAAEVRQLATEVRRTNEIVVALANHRHDVDGNTVFTVPSSGD